jgi:hypothetical protein
LSARGILLTAGHRKEEGRPDPWLRIDPDAASVSLNMLLHDRQPSTDATTKLIPSVQSLENPKHMLKVPWLNAYPVVTDIEYGLF